MDLDKERVQEFVDEAVNRYEENSILGNGVPFRTDETYPLPPNECRREASVNVDLLNTGMGLQSVKACIDGVTDCEEEKVLVNLEEEAELEESIDADEFGGNLFTESIQCLPLSSNNTVFLPNYLNYKLRLEDHYGTSEYLPHSDNIPIYWFDEDVFPRKGFVVNSRTYAVQETHGDNYSILNGKLGAGELDSDNSDNRLKIHLGADGGHPINVSLWSKFSNIQTIDDESICVLDLPDPDYVDPQT